jgi:hypothetical protein
VIAGLLLAASAVLAVPEIDRALTTGLALAVDPVPEALVVDGVPMTVQRITGRGVDELLERVESSWRRRGSQVRRMQLGEWTLLSRMNGSKSEVLQWRGGKDGQELLWSQLDSRSQPQPAPMSQLVLPAGCVWGRSVSGVSARQHYLQRSARCSDTPQRLSRLLRASLVSQGWQIDAASEQGLLVRRASSEGVISISEQSGSGSSWLVWLQLKEAL